MVAVVTAFSRVAEPESQCIARALRRRDSEFIGRIVSQYHYRPLRYLVYWTSRREQAEDLVQETWLRVLERAEQYNGRLRFEPWLFSIARNLAIDHLRKLQTATHRMYQEDDAGVDLAAPIYREALSPATGDILFRMNPAGLINLLPVFILVGQLYGTLVLGEKRAGYTIIFLCSALGLLIPVIHMKGTRGLIGGDIGNSGQAFLFVWTLLALGISSTFSITLSARALWSLPWRRNRPAATPRNS